MLLTLFILWKRSYFNFQLNDIIVIYSGNIKSKCMHAKLLQSCPTLWDTMDYSPISSSVHRIL